MKDSVKKISRRSFVKGSVSAAATISIVPAHVLGGPGKNPPSDKVNVAIIGSGGRGGSHVKGARGQNIVALVDADNRRFPSGHKNAKKFQDYRVMFDKMHKSLDAVSIATPDHNHAPAAMRAIEHDLNVYCEKPLTQLVSEARILTEAARKHKVITQMGNQGHCGEGYRILCEWIWDGAIGEVLETHSWTNRPIWPQGFDKCPPPKPVPDNLDWNAWLGPAPMVKYHDGLHPFNWRGWWEYGSGALGDMACHIMDGAFWALHLKYPTSVTLMEADGLNDLTYPKSSHIMWEFPERKSPAGVKIKLPPVKVHWWDGKKRPPLAEELEKKYERRLGDNGTIYVGTKGTMYTGGTGGGVQIIEPDLLKSYDRPEKTIPRVSGNAFAHFYKSIKAGKDTCANFDYAGPFTETVQMGNLCLRAGVGKKVLWDGKNMKVTNMTGLNQYITRDYRKGWAL